MTREQTIEKLKTLYTNAVAAMLRADACDDDESAKVMTEYAETLDSAITALTALQTDGDSISRQAAIDILHMDTSIIPYKKAREYADATILEIRNRLEKLPSAQPQYEELTPEEAASEIASGSTMSAWYWLDDMTRLKQMGYVVCRKR